MHGVCAWVTHTVYIYTRCIYIYVHACTYVQCTQQTDDVYAVLQQLEGCAPAGGGHVHIYVRIYGTRTPSVSLSCNIVRQQQGACTHVDRTQRYGRRHGLSGWYSTHTYVCSTVQVSWSRVPPRKRSGLLIYPTYFIYVRMYRCWSRPYISFPQTFAPSHRAQVLI